MQVSASKKYKEGPFSLVKYIRIFSIAKMIPQCCVFLTVAIGLLMPVSMATAEETMDWWFDVEVIAFKRDTSAAQVEEDFSSVTYVPASSGFIDLLSLPLYQKANPVVALQAMLYECSVESILYASNLPLLDLNATSLDNINSRDNSLPNIERSFSSVFFSPAELGTKVLTPEKRFNILLDPLNCSEQKKALADALLHANSVDKVNVYLEQDLIEKTKTAHLLADSQLNLIDYAKKLFAQRDIKALAHIAWRQPVVFGEDNARFFKLFFGDKLKLPKPSPPSYAELKQIYDPETSKVISQNSETFFDELKQQLAEGKKITWLDGSNDDAKKSELTPLIDDVWELDGMIKVYLENVNRVPYLHIDSEFQFSEISLNTFAEAHIEQYPFKQRRRVISKQIHYFDHPKIGLIVRLQRYEKPAEEAENEDIY